MKRLTLLTILAFTGTLAAAAPARAQQGPLTDNGRMMYGMLKLWVQGAAEKMPSENYDFKPTEAVRSFGQIIGHLADNQYHFCSVILAEKAPGGSVEKTRTSKSDLLAALAESFTYCDRAYAQMNDKVAADIVKLDGRDFPRLRVLDVNSLHTSLHYGNLITYLRLKNIVPPSSDAAFMARALKQVN